METAMRKTKREIIAAKASGDDDMFIAKSIRLRRQKEEYAKFSDKAGLLMQNERTQVYGFDKSISAKAAWAVRKAAKPIDNGGGSGIIKSIDVDDFTMMASSHEKAPEVSNLIANTIREYEKKGGMYISDMHFGNFIDEDTGKPALMQIFQNYYGLTEININSAIMAGKTLDEIDSIIAAAKSNLPQNLREAVIHECGHAKAYYGKTPEEVMAMNEHIKDRGVDGISRIAKNDGAECIAEVEVLLSRGEPISEKAMELYNAYVKGGKRK